MKHKTPALRCAFCQKPLFPAHYTVTIGHTDSTANDVCYAVCEACLGRVSYALIQIGVQNLEEYMRWTQPPAGLKQ